MYRCKACGAMNQIRNIQPTAWVCGRCRKAIDRSGLPQDIDATSLDTLVRTAGKDVPVLVDFWGPRCVPSRAAEPIVEEVARESAGRLVTVKLNTETNPSATGAHSIQGLPTLLLFVNGREVARRTGPGAKSELRSWIHTATLGAA